MQKQRLTVFLILSLIFLTNFATQITAQYYPYPPDSSRNVALGVNIDPTNPAGQPPASQLSSINSTFVRIEYKDSSSGSPTQLDYYNTYVEEYTAAGLKVLMILDYSSYPGSPTYYGSEEEWAAWIPQFAQRCQQVAAYFGSSVYAYEIWNEEDQSPPSPAYDPTVAPSIYASLLSQAYTAIKGVSSATIVMGGLDSGNPNYVTQVINASPNGQLACDAVGLHPYGQRPWPNWPSSSWGFGVITSLLQSYYNVCQGKPLWITEVGTTDTTCQGQFPYNVFQAVNDWNAAACPVIIWYCWSDGMNDGWGLVDVYSNPKQDYYSFNNYGGIPCYSSMC